MKHETALAILKAVLGPTVAYAAAGWADLCTVKDIQILKGIQHTALLPALQAYRTTSNDALCVISGTLPIDILLKQRIALYALRRGRVATIGEKTLSGWSQKKEDIIREEAIEMWQSQWHSSSKGRTTFEFFKDVRERLKAPWIKPGHHATQILTGHGNFNAKLFSFKLTGSDRCSCGGKDTAKHVLFDCPKNSDLRKTLAQQLDQNNWPSEANFFVATPEFFTIFTRYCKEVLLAKDINITQLPMAIRSQPTE